MKKHHLLKLILAFTLLCCPVLETLAQETAPVPAPKAEEKSAKAADPDKEKWNAVRKQASEDPKVKAAMDAASEAKRLANLKMYAKMREIDPALGAKIDAEEAKLKAKEVKPVAATTKPVDKKTVPEKAATEKKTAAPAKDKTVTPVTEPKSVKPAKDKTITEPKVTPDAEEATKTTP